MFEIPGTRLATFVRLGGIRTNESGWGMSGERVAKKLAETVDKKSKNRN